MDQRDFNRQMGAYLSSRRDKEDGRSIMDRIKESIPKVEFQKDDEPQVVQEDSVSQEAVQAVLRGESIPASTQPESIEPREQETIQTRRIVKPWWQSLMDKFTLSYDKEEFLDAGDQAVEEEIQELVESTPKRKHIDSDVKEMLRICVHWVNQLPPERIQEIRRSDDYAKFKKLLEKYDLLKK